MSSETTPKTKKPRAPKEKETVVPVPVLEAHVPDVPVVSEAPVPAPVVENVMPSIAEAQARIMAIPITDENSALNVMVSFLNIAQRRGAFSIDEASKIWECIKKFQK
jgi:hypothetical protein